MKSSLLFALLPLCTITYAYIDTPTLKATDFNDGTLGPFEECTTLSPSLVDVTSGSPTYSGGYKLTSSYNEDYWDGTRNRKSAEFCASNSNTQNIHKEGWQGFAMYIPSAEYPTSGYAIIAQQFCFGYCNSWCAALALVDQTIVLDRRSACGTPIETTVVSSVTFDAWHTFIVNIRFSNIEDGHCTLWYDGTSVYNATDINIGFDSSWTTNGSMVTGAYFKNGQYNADESTFTNITKVLYFDNVSWYNVDDGASNGYDTVNPAG